MNVANVDGASYYGVNAAATAQKKSELDMNQFIRLLTVQLANQNPLEPMNDRDFFAQMAQLGQVQGMEKLQDSSDLQQAQSLMGKRVTALRNMAETGNGQAQLVEGVVKKLSIKNGEYFLGIQEANGGIVEVGMKSLQSVAPSDDVASASYLIGKQVAGLGYKAGDPARTPVDVIGKVIGVSSEDGRTVLQVKTEDGNVTIPLSNLAHVTE
ncbi:MAG: flagellar hook assembly protein FlgD [Fimbriimonas sp.]